MSIISFESTFENRLDAGIFGLQPWAFMIVAFVLLLGAMYVYNLVFDKWKHDKNLKKVTMPDGKTFRMNGIFLTSTGQAYERLCDVDMHEVTVKGDKNLKKTSGAMFAPKVTTQRIPQYYIHTKFIHSIMWPKGVKASQQVSISQSIYRENFPLPAFSYEEMTEEERVKMTAILSGVSADQNVANAVVTEIQQKFDAFTKAVKELKNLKIVLILVFVNIAISAFNILMALQSFNLINGMRAFFGVK